MLLVLMDAFEREILESRLGLLLLLLLVLLTPLLPLKDLLEALLIDADSERRFIEFWLAFLRGIEFSLLLLLLPAFLEDFAER